MDIITVFNCRTVLCKLLDVFRGIRLAKLIMKLPIKISKFFDGCGKRRL